MEPMGRNFKGNAFVSPEENILLIQSKMGKMTSCLEKVRWAVPSAVLWSNRMPKREDLWAEIIPGDPASSESISPINILRCKRGK